MRTGGDFDPNGPEVRDVRNLVRLGSMDDHRWGRATWPELAARGLSGVGREGESEGAHRPVVALLPLGAVEAHGPHLPLLTDLTIATAAAEASVEGFTERGVWTAVLPPVCYTPAPFAEGFPGTVSVRPSTLASLVTDVAESLDAQGVASLVLVNAHLDPAHLEALHGVVRGWSGSMDLVFPDISRKPWALRLTDEFKSGACHAGRYETSVVMAADPGAVREAVMLALPENPASLSNAIRLGLGSFEEAGVDEAYCGAPAEATAAEGRETIASLAGILVDAWDQASNGSAP